MLTQETKRKIDSARQILVGKVPDPKAQIDQITTALIYKFMDDMDKDAMELGGKARFFTNGFEKYAWSKILDPKLGGHDRLELYAEAITKLWQNNHLPQLFRDIFKDAFLPYRSPETLSLFLKEINGFTYNHSEDLGDAFEYLLSIMSSQGDAGQFRTPRHIIDFITEVVDPKKDESILDPACGTAGFLISAYKHILKQHDGKDDPDRKEKPLTPDDKKKLMNNLVGYDISPDMVKLSKVNMYLHGFAEPKIYEYDTLSSDEKWDEMYDVIMANPPFMSPKGGIRPHKRFSVQANRAEVLFVDYIKEHLRPNGRAGVIVPEGIIFQTGTAYKQLRKLLVEDGLFAVVSLPQGVFNPYAGVKTSILFFDNALAKRVKHILFIKVNSDGFDLGAQRRAIVTNDLPMATEALTAYSKFLTNGGVPDKTGWPGIAEADTNPLCQFVSKEEIAKDGDFNLSSERYETFSVKNEEKWPMVELGDERYFKIESGGTPSSTKAEYWNGKIHWATLVDLPSSNFITNITDTNRKITQNGLKNSSAKLLPKHSVLVSSRATIGRVGINEVELATNQGFKNIVIRDEEKVNYEYVALMLTQLVKQMELLATGGTFKEISKTNFSKLRIPLPPATVQKKVVEYLRSLEETKEINQQENTLLSKLQLETIQSVWKKDNAKIELPSKEEALIAASFSDCMQMIDCIHKREEINIFFEHLILSLRELTSYIQRYFPNDVGLDTNLKMKKIVAIRNAICHRSSGLSFMSPHFIIQGGFNIKDEDIEIQYGKTKLYLLADVVSLYREFRQTVVSSSLLGRLAKHPSWQIDEKKLEGIEAKLVNSIKERVMRKIT